MRAKNILWNFIKEYKWRYLVGIVFLLITSFITSLIPKIIGIITDSLKDKMPVSVINKHLVLLISAAVAAFVFRFIWRYFMGNCGYFRSVI